MNTLPPCNREALGSKKQTTGQHFSKLTKQFQEKRAITQCTNLFSSQTVCRNEWEMPKHNYSQDQHKNLPQVPEKMVDHTDLTRSHLIFAVKKKKI